mgnify:CR=1 FL=1
MALCGCFPQNRCLYEDINATEREHLESMATQQACLKTDYTLILLAKCSYRMVICNASNCNYDCCDGSIWGLSKIHPVSWAPSEKSLAINAGCITAKSWYLKETLVIGKSCGNCK